MKSIPGSRAAKIGALVALAAFTQSPVRASRQQPNGPFLARLEAAANAGDADKLRAATVAGVMSDYSWARHGTSLIGPSLPWQTKELTLPDAGHPGAEQIAFVAFSKYHPCESTGDHLYRLVSTPEGPRLGAELPETDIAGWRVRDHRLTVAFNVPAKSVRITDHVTIDRLGNALPDALLRLNAIYTVDAAKSGGVPTPFRQAGGFLAVHPPTGDRIVLDLAYHARIDRGSEDYILPDQAGLTSYWYPHTGRLPATSDVRITVPHGWTAIGEGEPTGKSATPSSTTFAFHNRLAVCYITVAAGKYKITTRKVGGVPVSAYLLHNTAERAANVIETAGNALQWFSHNFSKYPYSRYAVVETDVFPAALECYSYTLCGRATIPVAIPHEVSHTWWGGIVPNTYTRTLWNESFAEYSDGLYERMTGRGGLHQFNAQVMGAMRPLLSSASLMQAHDAMDMAGSAIGYGKGSMVLETLERMLGTKTMLACMRAFIAQHNTLHAGEDAEWQDFIDAVANVAGSEWRGFFPSWLDRTDLPEPKLQDVHAEKQGDRYLVTGVVAQAEPAFWMKLPIVVDTASGQTPSSVDVRGPAATFRVETRSAPKRVSLDPHHEALRAGSAKESPTLLSLQASSQPLLVVRATGGSPAETSAIGAVSAGLKNTFPFARITVAADTDVTLEQLGASNVLLLGRPESLKLPRGWLGTLALDYGEGRISMGTGGRVYTGTDLWGLALMPHPSRPGGILAQAAGAPPAAIRGFTKQGDLPSLDSLFIVHEDGKVVEAMAPRSDDGSSVVIRL